MSKKKKQTSNQLEVQNAAKTLYANIRFLSVDDPIRSIVITSSVPNEGKTTTSVNLAQAIATSGKRVLLVEADMRRRSLASTLQVRASAGLYAVITEAASLSSAVTATNVPNLSFLDVEPSIPNPADLLASKRFARFAALLEESYDYVIYDTPPVGTFVDAAIMSTLADATLMVVRPNLVKRTELQHAYEQLQKADANVIGLCATFVEGSGSEYYYAYYTESGKRVKEPPVQPAAQPASPAGKASRRGSQEAHPPAQSRQQAYRQQTKGQPAAPSAHRGTAGAPAGQRNVDGTYPAQSTRSHRR